VNILDSIFDGLLGYERLMLICGFVLFVFALMAITVMIVQRRDFKMAMALIVLAIVLMGFPGIQAIKFSKDMVELDRIRSQPPAPASPEQQQAQQTLTDLQRRAEGDPKLLAQVSDGYRAIGQVDKAYQLAEQVLRQKPSAEARATLVPVLTAKLNQVQADAAIKSEPRVPAEGPGSPAASATGSSAPAASAPSASSVRPPSAAASSAVATTGTSAPAPSAAGEAAKQHRIAVIASQLQATGSPLPAESHAALAKAYVILDEPQKARANIDAARRINPDIRINARVLHAAKAAGQPPGSQP
jgi:hypothetical protein